MAVDELGDFCPIKLDNAFGKKISNFILAGDGSLGGSEKSPRERLRLFLANKLEKRAQNRRAAKLAFAKNLRALVLLVLKHEGKMNISGFDIPGSIPPDQYEPFRQGIAKALPTFWETIVSNKFGDEKVMHHTVTT
jgi:hypothetical protein